MQKYNQKKVRKQQITLKWLNAAYNIQKMVDRRLKGHIWIKKGKIPNIGGIIMSGTNNSYEQNKTNNNSQNSQNSNSQNSTNADNNQKNCKNSTNNSTNNNNNK